MKLRALLICLLALSLAGNAWAEFKRDYGTGRKALDKGNYLEAIEDLEKAIADNPSAQDQVRIYGMRFEPYIPYYYLGAAHFGMGNCEAAVTAWQKSISEGLVTSQPQYADLQRDMASCQSQTVDLSEYLADANSAISELQSANNRFSELESEALLASEWSSRWAPELSRSESLVSSLRQQLAAADSGQDQAAMEAIVTEASNASNAIEGSRDLARARITSLAAEQDRQARDQERLAIQQKEKARRDLDQALATAGDLTVVSGNDEMATLKGQLDDQVTRARGLSASATTLNMQELTRGINNTLRRYQQAEQDWRVAMQRAEDMKPPPLLHDIAQAYFDGDYQGAQSMANPDALDKQREKIQALLFRAAASHKLYVLGGQSQSNYLEQARQDIRAIKRLKSDFRPYIAAFSPNFLALYQETG
jgi:tetratricopeptide (TPR) repeat protein